MFCGYAECLFNHVLHRSTVASFYRDRRGHHLFAKQWTEDSQIKPVISDDAVEFASKNTLGPNVKWEGDHPNKLDSAHREYNNTSDRNVVIDYIAEKGITAENPMTVRQMGEVITRLHSVPFNVTVQQYVTQQVNSGAVIFGRSVGRGAAITYQPGD